MCYICSEPPFLSFSKSVSMLVLLAANPAIPIRRESTNFGFSRSMLVDLASFPTQQLLPKVQVCAIAVPVGSIEFTCTVVRLGGSARGSRPSPGKSSKHRGSFGESSPFRERRFARLCTHGYAGSGFASRNDRAFPRDRANRRDDCNRFTSLRPFRDRTSLSGVWIVSSLSV